MGLIAQEVSAEPWIDIPGEVLDILRLWRPTPLVRAERLERALGTPARIYFKDESVSPAGSHKPNTAVPQAFYNQAEGIDAPRHRDRRRAVGTRAGVRVRAVRPRVQGLHGARVVRAEAVPHESLMETWGASVVPSPVDDADHPGSLGLAISDAVRDAATRDDTHYSLGSVLNHVLLHQTVIGLEAKEQLALAGEARPDVVIGSCGGGSNLGGIALPFVPDADVRLVAVEPSSCPTLTEGSLRLRLRRHRGHDAAAADVHARPRLRAAVDPRRRAALPRRLADHLAASCRTGRMEAVAYPQGKTFEAAVQFASAEGKIPAPETGHAIRAVIDEALAAKETGEERVILFNYSGHGFLDLAAYDDFLNGRLIDA